MFSLSHFRIKSTCHWFATRGHPFDVHKERWVQLIVDAWRGKWEATAACRKDVNNGNYTTFSAAILNVSKYIKETKRSVPVLCLRLCAEWNPVVLNTCVHYWPSCVRHKWMTPKATTDQLQPCKTVIIKSNTTSRTHHIICRTTVLGMLAWHWKGHRLYCNNSG